MFQSSSNTNKALTNTINQSLTDIMNSTMVSTRSNINSSQLQDVDLTFDGPVNCNFDFSQNINVISKIYSKVDAVKEQQIKAKLSEDITNDLQSILEQAISGIGFGGNIQDTEQYISNDSVTQISSIVSNSLKNNINNAVNSDQQQKLKITFRDQFNCDDFFAVSQNIDVSSVIDNTLKDKNVTSVIQDISKKVGNKVSTEVTQDLKGLDFATMIALIVIGLIVVIGGVVGGIIFMKMKSGKTIINKFGRRKKLH